MIYALQLIHNMKYVLLFFFIVSFSNVYSQDKDKDLLVTNKISKRITQGFEYQNGSVTKQTYHLEEIDANGNIKSFKTYDLNKVLIKETNYTISKDGMTRSRRTLDKEGNLKKTRTYTDNKEARSTRLTQLNVKGDTIVEQLWIRDQNLNDSILFKIKDGKRTVFVKWKYNDDGVLLSRARFDMNGNVLQSNSFTYKKKGNCVKTINDKNILIAHECTEGNRTIDKILKNRIGYLAGIKLMSEKGGERIETRLENGLREKVEYFSKKGTLLSVIKYSYETN